MSVVLTSTAPPPFAAVTTVPDGFFQKSVPGNIILGTFFAVTLPLATYIWWKLTFGDSANRIIAKV